MLLFIEYAWLGVGVFRLLDQVMGVNLWAKLSEKSLVILPIVSSSAPVPVVFGDNVEAESLLASTRDGDCMGDAIE